MARIRSLRPEGAHDARLARVSRACRYHHLGLKRVADDHGYFRASPRLLLGQLYPFDRDLGEALVNQMTAELADIGLVELWQTQDGPIGRLVGWEDPRDAFYEHVARPSRSFLAEQLAALQPLAIADPHVLPLFPTELHADVVHMHADVLQCKNRVEESGSLGVREPESQGVEESARATTDLSYAQQCTIAANRALECRLGGAYKPLVASVEAETADVWQRDGVPLPVAIAAITEVVARYRPAPHGRQPRTLRYFDGAVREAWERARAASATPAGTAAPKLRRITA
jgi:hypothetical protein